MPRLTLEFEIETTESPEDVLERVGQALEVARYNVCHGSVGPSESHPAAEQPR
ncbi:hypothetical protein [Nocardiopsis sp. L17-MgMaSL7]|uniref:hypothetical protein n=1 Tax=Nocardiopsis sp. L17-MgMaSL7 TaxID=1938893 RepID=UPI000D924F72|nr:hypothetical protein [Nocardiopsis sp. L17-MgMaSL7]PWV44575.1 hypothetical protein BDW27_12334 [Nocardiopsis sp. L17-MgMaSL7]